VLSDDSIGRQHRPLFSAWCSVPALPKSAQSAAIPLYSRHEWYGGGPGDASTRTAGRCLWTGGIGPESGFGARFRGGDQVEHRRIVQICEEEGRSISIALARGVEGNRLAFSPVRRPTAPNSITAGGRGLDTYSA
jgi:hypothetical protein